MAFIPAHDKSAAECRSEIDRLTVVNDRLLQKIMDRKTPSGRRSHMLQERYLNSDYLRRLRQQLERLEA